jgi:hypothetical protein
MENAFAMLFLFSAAGRGVVYRKEQKGGVNGSFFNFSSLFLFVFAQTVST